MGPTTRWSARIALTAALLAGLAAASRIPVGSDPKEAVLRIALRLVGAKLTTCRERTEEELASLPPHMRIPRECRDRILPYRLRVAIDGKDRLDRVYRPAGASSDRPLVVQEEIAMAAGSARVELRFEPEPVSGAEPGEETSSLLQAIASAPRYRLEREVRRGPGEVALVELDETSGRIVLWP
jgi:hypothetical protein